jgi:hypothetical protein
MERIWRKLKESSLDLAWSRGSMPADWGVSR